MSDEIKECPPDRCDFGADYWSVVQFCGQDKLWKDPATAQVVMAFPGEGGADPLICYCKCAPGKKYCYNVNCVSNMPEVMRLCALDLLDYKEFLAMGGQDPDPCDCPCPHPECDYCKDPDIVDYVKETCEIDGWWPGYPIVMSAGGKQFCTCLCPDDTATGMTTKIPDGSTKNLSQIQKNDMVLAADRALNWAPRKVRYIAKNASTTPIPAVRITAGGQSIALAGDQLIVRSDRTLVPAIALEKKNGLCGADGQEMAIDNLHKHDTYAASLTFLGLSDEAPDHDLSGRLLNLNGFVVGDYSTQLYYTLDQLGDDVLTGSRI